MTSPRRSPPTPIRPAQLAAALGGACIAPHGPSDGSSPADAPALRGISHDSRSVGAGEVFACVVGRSHDGHRSAADAVAAGAAALLVSEVLDAAVPQIVVPNVRDALGPASAAVWGDPWRRCKVVGVTGTAGKTTVTHAIAAIANACGVRCEVIGTLDGPRTTPEAPELCRRLSRAADAGSEMVALEVSSHALAERRVDGARFAAGVFTNLSHEHLDFHGSMEEYFAAKARLFDGRSEIAVVNVADSWGRRLAAMAARTAAHVAPWRPSDFEHAAPTERGLAGRWRGRSVSCGLLGRLNAANVAAAAAAASALGLGDDAVAAGIAALVPVPGRLWPVSGPQDDITVLVDYAHKPEALAAALSSAREMGPVGARLWAVFGAGGDRDRAKRPLMGAAADRHADVLVLTSDNPRSEDPARIAADVAGGVTSRAGSHDGLHVELDRSRAVSLAVSSAAAGDVVVLAGKGHETRQTAAGRSVPFDDATAAAEALRRRRSSRR